MHRVGERKLELYRPATGLWIQLPSAEPIYPGEGETTLIYRDNTLDDESCLHLASLIRRLHHILGRLGVASVIPTYYLIDDPEYDLDSTLTEMLDEL
jgi:hypothetical protein